MSKQCPECGGTNTSKDWYAHDQGICYVCADCCYVGDPEEFREQTVFDHITQSEEALADKMVYAVHYGGLYFWHSTLIYPAFPFETREAAKAATVAELEKEYKT